MICLFFTGGRPETWTIVCSECLFVLEMSKNRFVEACLVAKGASESLTKITKLTETQKHQLYRGQCFSTFLHGWFVVKITYKGVKLLVLDYLLTCLVVFQSPRTSKSASLVWAGLLFAKNRSLLTECPTSFIGPRLTEEPVRELLKFYLHHEVCNIRSTFQFTPYIFFLCPVLKRQIFHPF